MPYKSEKIKIAGTKHDRRRKLTEDQKQYIRWLREEEKISYQKLADMFDVSKRLIIFICKPEIQQKARERFKKYKAEGRYKPTKEEWAETMKEHRHYKQKLFCDGKIKESADE
jgi:DNA polymerase IIIc chi subunit